MKLTVKSYLFIGGSFLFGFTLCFLLTTNLLPSSSSDDLLYNIDDTTKNIMIKEVLLLDDEYDASKSNSSSSSSFTNYSTTTTSTSAVLVSAGRQDTGSASTTVSHGVHSSFVKQKQQEDHDNDMVYYDFTITILTMHRAQSLKRLLDSLEATDYGDDKIHLIFKIDLSSKNQHVIDLAESFNFTHGHKSIFIAEKNMGLARSWFYAWMPKHDNDYGIILEDDIEMASDVWYKWIKKAWLLYDRDAEMSPNHMAGISLCRQTLVPLKPHRQEVIVNDYKPYLYRLVGSIGFSPHPKIWKKFVAWINSIDLDTFDVSTPELVTSDAWNSRAFDKRHMWTQHFIYFSKQHNLFTLYQTLLNEKTFASHMRESGEHFKKTVGRDFELATKDDVYMDYFPEKYDMLNKYDWDGKLIMTAQDKLSDNDAEAIVLKQQDDQDSNLPLCLMNSLYQLCVTLEEDQLNDCYANPKSFVEGQFEQYVPSKKEEKASRIMKENKINKISIGAAQSGICDDITTGETLCTDRDNFDLLKINSWMNLFGPTQGEGFGVLFAEHVLEHFDPMQVQQIAAMAFSLLMPGGVFRIAVPDGYKPSPSYQNYIRAGGTESNAGQNHMVAWTVDTLPTIFEKAGFDIKLREYFTKEGKFVSSHDVFDNDEFYGKVKRSSKDVRNVKPLKDVKNAVGTILVSDLKQGEPMYTSLWFDAVKPMSCEHTLVGEKGKRLSKNRNLLAENIHFVPQHAGNEATTTTATRKYVIPYTVIIGGIARDISPSQIQAIVPKMKQLGEAFKDYHILVYENNSDDESKNSWRDTLSTLGDHATFVNETIKYRCPKTRKCTETIAAARNKFMNLAQNDIKDKNTGSSYDYVIVTDLDGVCGGQDPKISYNITVFHEAFAHPSKWDALSFRTRPYWDRWAFRHPDVMPYNMWYGQNKKKNKIKSVEDMERYIEKLDPNQFHDVESAFMMMSIYRMNATKDCFYNHKDDDGNYECEHVPFHKDMRLKNNAKIAILPQFHCAPPQLDLRQVKPHLHSEFIESFSFPEMAGIMFNDD
mmetsp:Transcript_15547/g.29316  ORF Transcript_15547/g.29316 Transcript_15547/m.29316 type:complete len:1043 (+) Transcript_15547:169-3297(+)